MRRKRQDHRITPDGDGQSRRATIVQKSRELYDTAIREWQIVQTGDAEFIVFRRPPTTSPDTASLTYQRVTSSEEAESFVRTELLREVVEHTIAACSS